MNLELNEFLNNFSLSELINPDDYETLINFMLIESNLLVFNLFR
jgi:hypothetical protein